LTLLHEAFADEDPATHAILYVCAERCFVFGRWRS